MRKIYYRCLWLSLFYLAALPAATAQRVGLVLSGGGAKGLAHVGVLKQLEANGIPIDYIVGTSMGAIVGAMYAAGYSPREIEQIVLSPEFQNWTSGQLPADRVTNYLAADPSPASLRLGVAVDSTFKFTVRPSILNDLQLNFALTRLLAPAGARAGYDFDKLFVPFRCNATEVFTRQGVVQRAGSLSQAVRNSMSFPLAFRPIRNPDGRYLFDGAIVNNFPTDVMRQDFRPDVIIGVNVGDVALRKYPFRTDDDLLTGTLAFLGISVADTNSVGRNGIFIQPELGALGAASFGAVRELVADGDSATQRKLALIKERITRRVDTVELARRRQQFQAGAPRPRFVEVRVQGLRPDQNRYAQRFFRKVGSTYTIDDIEDGYYRLGADDFFRNIFPRIRFDPARDGYVFSVDAQRNNNVAAEVGFALATRPIDALYLGVEYKYLTSLLYTVGANVTVGGFYNGAQGTFRLNAPGRLPFFVQPQLTYNQWNYQNTGGVLGRDVLSTQVRQQDTKIGGQIGLAPRYRSRVVLDLGAFFSLNSYSNLADITSSTVLDRSSLKGFTGGLSWLRNSLNRKQYATAGRRATVALRGVTGKEVFNPGSTSRFLDEAGRNHQWLQVQATYEQYLPVGQRRAAWGYFGELTLSSQGGFASYRSSLTIAPTFAPLPDSRTLFLDRYRSPRYAAAGLRYSQGVFSSLEWRTEVYAHVNIGELRDNNQLAETRAGLSRPYLTGTTGLVFNSPVGPLALNAVYYDDPNHRFGLFAHLGYVLFRNRALE